MTSARTSHRDSPQIDALRRHDAQAVAELLSMVHRHLSGALRHRGVTVSDLDDLAQEASLRVLEKLETFRGDASFSTWVSVIAVRSALAHLRRTGSRAFVPLDDQLTVRSDSVRMRPDRQLLTAELQDALREGVECALTERQRAVIVAELHGESQVRIAVRLDMTPNAVYKMSHDARKKLKGHLISRGLMPGHDHDTKSPVKSPTS